jgi:hypothetical protein
LRIDQPDEETGGVVAVRDGDGERVVDVSGDRGHLAGRVVSDRQINGRHRIAAGLPILSISDLSRFVPLKRFPYMKPMITFKMNCRFDLAVRFFPSFRKRIGNSVNVVAFLLSSPFRRFTRRMPN